MSEPSKERIGCYELTTLIGDGAQGKVFQARCIAENSAGIAVGEIVAIKVLRIASEDERAHRRVKDKADILRNLSHPNIVRYRDSFTWHPGEWDEAQCLVMEFLEGETFDVRLKKFLKGLPLPEVASVFEQCLAGLIYAKEQGIIHRDLKPSNIFLANTGVVKIFDFDIALRENDSQMSTMGWKGTFDYMAPDFVTGGDFRGDELSDIFSLGVCIFQALTGKPPFEPLGEGAHIGYMNRWRAGGTPPELSFRSSVFRVLANAKSFFGRSLNPQRAQRYQSFVEMLGDFQRVHYRTIQHRGKAVYELREVLGRGGFGEVFRGVVAGEGRQVAIKHLYTEKHSARFIKEARILQSHTHPHIVEYIDFVVVEGAAQDNQYFLIMELLEGMPEASLRTRIKREGRMEPAEVLPLFINYLDALTYLHENFRPIMHRDIKPNNLYAPPGRPEQAKIFDLGVARDVSGTVTTGGVPGTLDYMAPEFSKSGAERGSPQSDLYALGLCLYEALTGQPAMKRLPADINLAWIEFQERSSQAPRIDFNSRTFRLYPRLKAVVQKALAPNLRERYARAAKMRQDLEEVLRKLDQPAVDIQPEEEATVAGSAQPDLKRADSLSSRRYDAASRAVPKQREAEPSRGMQDDGTSSPLPELPEVEQMDGKGIGAFDLRRRRAITAAGVILVCIILGAGAELVWLKMRRQPEVSNAAAAAQPQARAIIPPATQLVQSAGAPGPGATQTVAAAPSAPGIEEQAEARQPTPAPEAEAVKAAREEIELLARTLRPPVPELAYIKNVDAAHDRVRKLVEQNPALLAESQKVLSELDRRFQSLPDMFAQASDQALARRDINQAERLVQEWRACEDFMPRMNLTAQQFAARRAEMERKINSFRLDESLEAIVQMIPAAIAGDQASARLEQAARKLAETDGGDWPGIDAADKKARLEKAHNEAIGRMTALVAALGDQAIQKYAAGENGDAQMKTLSDLKTNAPSAVALTAEKYDQALLSAQAARAEWQARVAERTRAGQVAVVATGKPAATAVGKPIPEAAPKAGKKPEPAPALTPDEREVIEAVKSGRRIANPQALAGLRIDGSDVADLLAAANETQKGFKVLALWDSYEPARLYLARIAQLWKKAAGLEGNFGQEVRDAAWINIHTQLVKQAELLVRQADMLVGGVRTPEQQARVRREYLRFLAQVEDVTGRLSACGAEDPLRAQVLIYFQKEYFHKALIEGRAGEDKSFENKIPWVKDEFRKARPAAKP